MKHIHAEVIKAWADGAQIQFFEYGDWQDCQGSPAWFMNVTYRVKPEPKPDVEMVCAIKFPAIERWAWERPEIVASWIKPKSAGYGRYKPNIKFIFDGETEQLKSAEVMK